MNNAASKFAPAAGSGLGGPSDYRADWRTPPEFYHALLSEYGPFICDLAASKRNTKCKQFYTAEKSALDRCDSWPVGPLFCNPPYGRGIGDWAWAFARACEIEGRSVCAILPANIDAGWFHKYVIPSANIRIMRGRVQFVDPTARKRRSPTNGTVIALYGYGLPPGFSAVRYDARTFDRIRPQTAVPMAVAA